jgi:hypothetical protein
LVQHLEELNGFNQTSMDSTRGDTDHGPTEGIEGARGGNVQHFKELNGLSLGREIEGGKRRQARRERDLLEKATLSPPSRRISQQPMLAK